MRNNKEKETNSKKERKQCNINIKKISTDKKIERINTKIHC